LPEPRGSEPGFKRPVVIVQANEFNASRIRTIIVASITTNLALASAPGNVLLPRRTSGLREDSVINVSQVSYIDCTCLDNYVGKLPAHIQTSVDAGLRLVLGL
jgi:mRNA interferase MazF